MVGLKLLCEDIESTKAQSCVPFTNSWNVQCEGVAMRYLLSYLLE